MLQNESDHMVLYPAEESPKTVPKSHFAFEWIKLSSFFALNELIMSANNNVMKQTPSLPQTHCCNGPRCREAESTPQACAASSDSLSTATTSDNDSHGAPGPASAHRHVSLIIRLFGNHSRTGTSIDSARAFTLLPNATTMVPRALCSLTAHN